MNANSLVMRLDLGTTRALLMGDAEAGGPKDRCAADLRDAALLSRFGRLPKPTLDEWLELNQRAERDAQANR